MKKKLLILTLILSLGLTACNSSKNTTSTTENQASIQEEKESESSTNETEADILVVGSGESGNLSGSGILVDSSLCRRLHEFLFCEAKFVLRERKIAFS